MEICIPNTAKKYANLQCNNNLDDYTECRDTQEANTFLDKIKPKACLEIGCGIGRVTVYLYKKYLWDSTFYLLDGDSGDKQVAGIHYVLGTDYYNSLKATKDFCLTNGIRHDKMKILNAQMGQLPPLDTIDLCYSFKAIGFHWPIQSYLDSIRSFLTKKAILMFGIRSELRNAYSSSKIWNRRVQFNSFQISNIDIKKYKILSDKRNVENPVLVLEKREG